MVLDERAHPVVEHLGAQRGLADDTRLQPEALEVVIDLADHRVGERVAEDRPRPTAVQRPGVLGEEGGLLNWRELCRGNPHDRERTPVLGLNGQPKTFTALAITSPAVDSATIACTAIIALAQRASGMVSVGEKAITLVRLTYR